MTLQECYIAMGGDYEDVASRLRSERMVQKFILKFLDDGSYELLCASLAQKNYEEAFRAAHTIKGLCQNLSFTRLQESSSLLTEELRMGVGPDVELLMAQVTEDYQRTVRAIRNFREELGE